MAITTVNGSEFAAHELITEKIEVKVYFTDPYSAWQKESVENANKLIRQYIPKAISFKKHSDKKIKLIQHKLNRRPREKLGSNSPKNEFFKRFFANSHLLVDSTACNLLHNRTLK